MPAFITALFDFSFENFITPKLVGVIYALELLASVVAWIMFGVDGFTGGILRGIFQMFILAPIGFGITVIFVRVTLELFIAIFKIAEHTRALIEKP
ncbi:MAG: DUF4282 domain-containing protein [Gammaproteobacteria bacterium]|nr:DUF4282 domain-containing protein [Gammaproteobacteria bacterium]